MRVRTYVPAVFVVLLIALLTVSASTKETRLVTGINPGDLAPGIKSLENGSDLSFHNHLGRYTLLCFWAAYDGESRARNVALSNEVNKLDSKKIVMYSISLDDNQSIFEETLKIDKLDKANQLREGFNSKSTLYKAYKLKRGLKTFLIDDKGKIISVNIHPKQLAELLKNS
ncbi:thioredoxin-like domain-containing protein [Massilibacteroides sp.]|uniref:thioredoxin-like domain-containing protein n=1 Tax=Massilibacteroides sp. TaxID=2034766 RepID=UPI002610FC19|nr:thioredoxin-like domain-containing protein [Massilibacteroides sp.]MDD4516546.1 redoxin domain-containing protein [Massilibacteroides sp.]